MGESGGTIVDRAKFDRTRQELGVNFRRILVYFREDGEKAIVAIEKALDEQSAVALVRPAHTLKGESLQFGAEQLGEVAEAIEHAARRAVEARSFPHAIDHLVARLRPLFHQTLAFFDREMPAPPSPVRRAVGFGRKSV